jgi:hypothetical protein
LGPATKHAVAKLPHNRLHSKAFERGCQPCVSHQVSEYAPSQRSSRSLCPQKGGTLGEPAGRDLGGGNEHLAVMRAKHHPVPPRASTQTVARRDPVSTPFGGPILSFLQVCTECAQPKTLHTSNKPRYTTQTHRPPWLDIPFLRCGNVGNIGLEATSQLW